MSESVSVGTCRDGHSWVTDDRGPTCPACGLFWRQSRYTTRKELEEAELRSRLSGGSAPIVGVFKPFVESGFTGKGILVTSKGHRDALCAQHRVTPDKFSNDSKPSSIRPTVAEQLTKEDLYEALSQTSDGELAEVRREHDVERGDPERSELPTTEVPISDS